MGRRKDFLDDYTSSSDSSDDEDDFPGSGQDIDELAGHRTKRRRTGRDAKESAALGIFGEESDDEGPGWKKKNLRRKGMGFVSAGTKPEEEEEEDEEDEEPGLLRGGLGLGFTKQDDVQQEEGGDDEEERPRLGLGGSRIAFSKFSKAADPSDTSTPRSDDARSGLGFGVSPFGTQAFVPSSAISAAEMPKLVSTSPPEKTPTGGPSAFGSISTKKGKSADGAPQINQNSFAARMMAKMGYKSGQGLGRQGQGRLEPIAPKVRPQGVGVGAVKEMSEQEKREARRAAALRGEVLSDSESEKERKRKKKRREQRKQGGSAGSGASTPLRAKEKTKFRTADEITAETGLYVPPSLKNIIDYTGKERKLLTSASGLLVQPAADPESVKLAKMARSDLELFAKEWKSLQDRKTYVAHEEARLSKAIDTQVAELRRIKELADISKKLESLTISRSDDAMESVVSQLEIIQAEYGNSLPEFMLADVAVAALHPLFKSSLTSWEPLDDPFFHRDHLGRLRPILNIRNHEDLEKEYTSTGVIEKSRHASPFESLLITLWLPRVRSAITTADIHNPSLILTLLEVWSSVLPPFILNNIYTQLILPKLRTAIANWNPRLDKKHRGTPPLHEWVFQYLPHLPPLSLPDLLSTIRHKFGVLLDTCSLSSPLPGLDAWRTLLTDDKFEQTLIRHLLPRLALHLRQHLVIDPSDQDLEPLEQVLAWTPLLRPSTAASLLVAEFFPKWLAVLHQWLTSPDANLSEVQEWYRFWRDVIPESLCATPAVQDAFRQGTDLMNDALDLLEHGPDALRELPLPMAGPHRPLAEKRREDIGRQERKKREEKETTFKDVLEDWCAENDLLLVPTRKAHEETGEMVWRVTESASGKGGVEVRIGGDVVWVKERRRKEGEGEGKREWKPVGLEELGKRVRN